MSRILRRPMFRGGRVDARGTGIASGLGYAQGGQVQPLLVGQHPDKFKDAEGREQHWGPVISGIGSGLMRYGARPAMKYGRKGLDWLLQPKAGWGTTIRGGKSGSSGVTGTSGGTMDKYVQQIMPKKSISEMWKELGTSRAGGAGQFLYKDPLVKYPLKTIGGIGKGAWSLAKKPITAGALGYTGYQFKDEIGDITESIKDKWDEVFGDEPETPNGISPQEAQAIFGDDPELVMEMAGKSRAEAEAVLKEKLKLEKQALIDAKIDAEKDSLENQLLSQLNKKKTKKEKLAEMKENKEMLQEMYGTGRGEDASRMLMSAASRLLEPEATVKSGLGKFLGDESKVESKRSKYKDAATTGAIQMYLTGEKSFNDTMKAIELFKAQKEIDFNMKDAAKKDMSITEIKNTFFTSGSMKDREKTKGAAELWVEWNAPSGTSLTVIEGDEETPEYLQDPANEGKYIMNHETKEIFKIVEGIKKILYGG